MANILGLITVNDKQILEVDADPGASSGTPAPVGSEAMFDDGLGNPDSGALYVKSGPNDVDWMILLTAANSGVASGTYLRLPIYDMSPTGNHLADVVAQNANNIDIAIEAQASRSAAIEYRIPNPGDAVANVDFVLTEGDQTINGNKTFGGDVVVQGDFTVNGTLTYVNSTQTQVSDPLITLNKGGAAASGAGVGFEIEEDSAITGYFKTSSDRAGFVMLAPDIAFTETLDLSLLSANRTMSFPDTTGVFVARPSATAGVAGQVAFWSDANNVISDSGLFWNNTTKRLSIGSGGSPTNDLDLTGSFRMRSMTAGSVIFATTNGVLAQDNSNFFWDGTNHRLGIGTTSPTRPLDVNGASLFRGSIRYSDAGAADGDWQVFQAEVDTTDDTVTPLATIAAPTDSVMLLTANVTGLRTGGTGGSAGDCATYIRTVKVKNVAGTVTAPKAQADYTSEDNRAWDADIVVSGTNAIIQIAGDVDNDITWTVTYFVQILS